ncbi:MAG: 30S ribosomal protein S13 [Verrucomicrobia bacterium]|nr:30S ribosomal protein S13 [Verrucomicrobiota bacterium]MCH8528512.1 30S ribosomal protein S13 [Kiritimatiellia bacterium]
MPRIMGIDIPGRKRLEYSLRYIYGIGPKRALEIITKLELDPGMKADDLNADQINAITTMLQSDFTVEGDLRRETQSNIRRLISIGSYRGMRHRRGLPVRGQRTKTNARTRKGGKRTIGAVRGKEARAAAKAAIKK